MIRKVRKNRPFRSLKSPPLLLSYLMQIKFLPGKNAIFCARVILALLFHRTGRTHAQSTRENHEREREKNGMHFYRLPEPGFQTQKKGRREGISGLLKRRRRRKISPSSLKME